MSYGRKVRQALPIDARLGEILAALGKSQVVIVEAETGAGKSTRIGPAAVKADRALRVWHTLPRRMAVRTIGKRIAEEVGCEIGGLVGWRLYGEDPRVSHETRMTLQIDQTLANWIRREGRLPTGLVIIDEAHERSIPTDLLLGMIKEYLPNSPNTKVLITSATIDTQKFSAFFDGAPVVSVKGRCFPVRTEVVRLMKFEHHSQAAGRAAGCVIERFLAGTLVVPTEDNLSTRTVDGGCVPLLLPGKDDIASVRRAIERMIEEKNCGERITVLECHGESRAEEQEAVLEPVPKGTLRFVCATEVVRTSVTLPDVVGVIDSLQIKRMVANAKGIGHLIKIAVSKAEADQAKGRAGRTQPGFYMPCSFEYEYEGLAPYPTPQILMSPVSSVCLQVAAIGRSARNFAFVDAPLPDRISTAIRRLQDIGALDADEKITEEGEFLLRFPINPERAKCLVTASEYGVTPETVVACASLEAEGFYYRPRKDEKLVVDEEIARMVLSYYSGGYWQAAPGKPEEVDLSETATLPDFVERKEDGLFQLDCGSWRFGDKGAHFVSDLLRKRWAGDTKSDFVGLVRAYRAFKEVERKVRSWTEFNRRKQDDLLFNWCKMYQLNLKRLRMAEDTMNLIRDELYYTELRLENGLGIEREFDPNALTDAMLSGMTDNVAVLSGRGDYVSRLGDLQISFSSACPKNVRLALVDDLHLISTKRGGGQFQLAGCAAPLEAERIAKVVPHLCRATRVGDHLYDWTADGVTETEKLYLNELEVGSHRIPSPAADATRTLANALAEQMI